jgi:hypothetical protein
VLGIFYMSSQTFMRCRVKPYKKYLTATLALLADTRASQQAHALGVDTAETNPAKICKICDRCDRPERASFARVELSRFLFG